MEIQGKKGPEPFVSDEHPREASLEKLGQLPPVFKEGGVVTAGNASVRRGGAPCLYVQLCHWLQLCCIAGDL